MATVTLEIEFDEEEYEDGYKGYSPLTVRNVRSDIDSQYLIGVAETLVQSDFGTIGFPYGIIEAIEKPGETITFDHRM